MGIIPKRLLNTEERAPSFVPLEISPSFNSNPEILSLTKFNLESHQVEATYRDHVNPNLLKIHRLCGGLQIEKSAAGFWVKDHRGQTYLDCIGGFGVFSFGHSPQEIVEDVQKQLAIQPLSSKFLLSDPYARLAKVLALLTPGDLQYSFFCNSGTEAAEFALKLARASTGREEIIAMQGGYHGKTLGALSVSKGKDHRYRDCVEPLIPSCSHVPFGDVTALMLAVSEKTAAVILEPIQGEAGIVVPPPGFLREVRKICDFHGAFLILDEVQTGLGRTGKNFACEWEDVSPDILCLGKALGGGVMPLAGVVATAQAFKPLIDDPVFHTSTFGGNPLACVAGLAALRILVRDQLAQNAFLRGQYLLRGLQDLADAYPDLVLEVRGRGLMVGVEMHRPGQVGVLISLLRKRGILVCHTIEESGVIRLEPPLGITTVLIDYIVSNFKTALEEARQVLAS